MAFSQATVLVFFTLLACSSLSMALEECRKLGVSVVSPSHLSNETLRQLCDSECYSYLVIGQGRLVRTHRLGYDSNGVADAISYCQNTRKVKVLLSLVGSVCGEFNFSPEISAAMVWELYLNPNSTTSNLYGNARFDGIDFGFTNGSQDYYYNFALALKKYSDEIILSASPGCAYPSPYFDSSIHAGLIDVIWPKFFNNPGCDYSGGINGVVSAWKKWSESTPADTKLLIAVPVSPEGVESGYVPPEVFETNILPDIRYTEKYAGAMLWEADNDMNSIYASTVARAVCDYAGNVKCRASNGGSGTI